VIVEPLPLAGAARVRFEPQSDERGTFRRLFDRDAFARAGLADCSLEISVAINPLCGTLRGLHHQRAPHAETKLVTPLTGSIFDVLVDLRDDSPTRLRWYGEVLDAGAGVALYIPAGFAHGYLTLTDDAVVHYQMDAPYVPQAASGIAWDDPAIAVDWPTAPRLIGRRDAAWPRLNQVN
jgi:dTDP-4-dehydrorhamnose 3,5-epimerase